MAREVREKLRSKYTDCKGMGGFDLVDNSNWLKDEDALKFKEWMNYWESKEGTEKGGPPKSIEVFLSPMRIPTIEVELQFIDMDVISGFMLNENVFYCMECSSILKGDQAVEHLKKKGEVENPCSLNEGKTEEHPIKNDNLYLLHSSVISSPSSSLPCPLCPRKLCSITGLRIHMMVEHRVFVKYERNTNENVTNSMPSVLDIRSPLLRRKEKMKGPTKKLVDSDDKSGRNGRRSAKTRNQPGNGIGVRKRKAPPVVVHIVEGLPFLYDDSDDDNVVEVPESAADAAQVTLKPPIVTAKRDYPDGEADDEVIKYIVTKMVQNVVRNEEKEATQNETIVETQIVDLTEDEEDVVMEEGEEEHMEEVMEDARKIRVEAEDDNAVGGMNEPGYNDDDEVEIEKDREGMRSQTVIRSFTPDDDDELCVVAEVENNRYSTAATTSNNHREKKLSCPKCSSKFITTASLSAHVASDHKFDAGANMITEELGIPLSTSLYLCSFCTLAFPTLHLKKLHTDQHDLTRLQKCGCCSGVSNKEMMASHLKRIEEKKMGYICGECRVEFKHETNLHEHTESEHGVTLFYFCKTCEMGSTDSLRIYQHFMMNCPRGYRALETQGDNAQDHASKCIGVCPASLLHFQPVNLKTHKKDLEEYPERYVVPSLCSHRSMIVALEKKVTCDTCGCLEANSSHAALYEMRTGIRWADRRIIRAIFPPPLSRVRLAYEEWKGNRNEKKMADNTESKPSTSRVDPDSSIVFRRTLLDSAQQAQQRLNDRLNAVMQARGRRGPVSTGVNRIMMNGGGIVMRGGFPVLPSTPGGIIIPHTAVVSSTRAPTVSPGHGGRVPTSVLIGRALHNSTQQAQQNARMQARGSTRSENGGVRMPESTGVERGNQSRSGMIMMMRRGRHAPNPMGSVCIQSDGGEEGMRGLPMIHPTTGGSSDHNGGETRGPAVPPSHPPPPYDLPSTSDLSSTFGVPSPSNLPPSSSSHPPLPSPIPTLHSLLSPLFPSIANDDKPSTSVNPPQDQ